MMLLKLKSKVVQCISLLEGLMNTSCAGFPEDEAASIEAFRHALPVLSKSMNF